MFPKTSRYYGVPTKTITRADGREIIYLQRRFLPGDVSAGTLIAEHVVMQGERLDNITARYFNDPEQFWRICDANLALHPDELTDDLSVRTGRRLIIVLEGA
ncbi:MAG: LysM domain-containing protein [Chloroflexi bacterium]|nr:LysM domain-containing protein [Chloroflexota bacterium]